MANEPITREEILLNAVATGEAANLEPITREEMFLAKLGGADVTTPIPITRKEQFLQKAIENGGNAGSGGSGVGGGSADEGWIGDGNTHIWISLQEGRTSPMLGVCPKGTVTVDWGDGTTPDVLTGTSLTTVKCTPNHEYAKAGDYVITLTVNGEVTFGIDSAYQYLLRKTINGSEEDLVYNNAVKKVEIGDGASVGKNAFYYCYSLSSVFIPNSLTSIDGSAFSQCYSLKKITIPWSMTSIGRNAFGNCSSLKSIIIPDGVTSIAVQAFKQCYSLSSVSIPDSVTSIDNSAFQLCQSLASIAIPAGVTRVGEAVFSSCKGLHYIDFSNHTSIPTLVSTNAFTSVAKDLEIRVPAALYDEWIAATNWSSLASQIVAV